MAGTPQAAVTGFYQRAAAKDFNGAWALATPRAQSQVGGFNSWKAGEQDLTGFSFPKLQVMRQSGDSATVSFQSLAKHADRTDHCSGTIDTVRQGGGWMVDQLHIAACSRG